LKPQFNGKWQGVSQATGQIVVGQYLIGGGSAVPKHYIQYGNTTEQVHKESVKEIRK